MKEWDPTGKQGPKIPLPDVVTVHAPKEEEAPIREDKTKEGLQVKYPGSALLAVSMCSSRYSVGWCGSRASINCLIASCLVPSRGVHLTASSTCEGVRRVCDCVESHLGAACYQHVQVKPALTGHRGAADAGTWQGSAWPWGACGAACSAA